MRKVDVNSFILHSKSKLINIEKQYNDSLAQKTISGDLKIEIKNYMENLRSALDYMARDIHENILGPLTKEIKFPYGKNIVDFRSMINNNLSNLKEVSPETYGLLEKIQDFQNIDYSIAKFCELCNEKKHNNLIPQVRIEQNETVIGNAIRAGPGSFVAMHNCLINDIPINSENINNEPLENFDPRLNVKRIVWVSFKFRDTNIEVMQLLRITLDRISKLYNELYSILENN